MILQVLTTVLRGIPNMVLSTGKLVVAMGLIDSGGDWPTTGKLAGGSAVWLKGPRYGVSTLVCGGRYSVATSSDI